MGKIDFQTVKDTFVKTLEEVVRREYIVVNESIAIEGIAAMFANDLRDLENSIIEERETKQMLEALRKYYPQEFQEFIHKRKATK